MKLKVRIEEKDYKGTPVEILDQLRMEAGRWHPSVADYIRFIQDNIQQLTGMDCTLDGGDTPKRSLALLGRLEALGALEILEK